jgi:MFS transporter, FSR family, fosmidomycin resistance protein
MFKQYKLSVLIPILLFMWLGHFIIDFMIGIWPVYKSMTQLDLAKAGMIVAVGAFLGEGSQIIFGTLSDKGYRKALIVLGGVAATSSVFMAYFSSYAMLFVLYLLTCLGSGAFHPAGASLVNSLIPERRGLLMTLFASGGSIGLASSQLIFTHTYQAFEGQTWMLGLPTILLVLFALFYPFSQFDQPPGAVREKRSLKDFKTFFQRQDLRHLYLAQLANQTLMWGTIFILPDVLRSLGHGTWVCFGGGHSCLILGCALMMVPAGYLADKYSARLVMLITTCVSFVSFYLILFMGGMSMWLVLLLLFILGASIGVVNPVGVALGNRLVPDKPGAVSAFLMGMVWCVSEALGPGGVGLMTHLFDDHAPVKALAILGSFFLLGLYMTWRLPKTEPGLVTAH